MMKKYTVSEITKAIKNLIDGTFSEPVIITGEVSNFSKSPAGHIYFILKDEISQIKSVFFKRYNLASKGYSLKNGDKVSVYGDLSVFEAGGNYQIIVKKVEYDSEGEFYKKFAETKRKLEKEGLLEEGIKKPIPALVKKIALITSPAGAAVKDFIITSHNNKAKYRIDVWPTTVQGSTAALDIEKNILKAGEKEDIYDVLVLMRGGGSLEDLAVFNEENVARALRSVKVPTISAVGHERDITICDYTADLRVATPTAAASFLSEGYCRYDQNIDDLKRRLIRVVEHNLYSANQKLDNFMTIIEKNSPYQKIKLYKSEISRNMDKITDIVSTCINNRKHKLEVFMTSVKSKNPKRIINEEERKLLYLENYLLRSTKNKINYENERLKNFLARVTAMNPEHLISKGYALVYRDKKLISSINSLNLDDEVEIHIKGGYINAFVTGKKHLED